MSSFFTAPASQRKRKLQDASSAPASKRRVTSSTGPSRTQPRQPTNRPRATAKEDDDESISGSESEEEGQARSEQEVQNDSDSDDAQETAAERRLKLAERYLENIRAEVGDGREVGFDAEDVDRDLIAARLKEDVAEDKGRLYRHIAADFDYERASQTFFRADTLATTAVAVCPPYAYTVSKDMRLIKWELVSPPRNLVGQPLVNGQSQRSNIKPKPIARKPKQLIYTRGNKNRASDPTYQHHTAPILCIAASTSGKFIATGGADRRLIIWDAATLAPLKIFTQHRDAVTGLAFRGKTHQLFSGSKDRTIKIWSLDELAYVETLFGHADEVVDVSAVGGSEERCVSVGARDRTARLWKVVEESQLVFRGGGGGGPRQQRTDRKPQPKGVSQFNGVSTSHSLVPEPPRFAEGSLDRVIQLDTQLFVTGSDCGALSLFALHKKKPLHTYPLAHGFDPPISATESSAEADADAAGSKAGPTARWITALAGIPYSDLFVSGSWDGVVRVWRVGGEGGKKIEAVASLGCIHQGAAEELADRVPAGDAEGGIGAARGIINDLAVFARGDRGNDGLCVVAGMGTETRLGRWVQKKGRNGAVVFEVPSRLLNGVGTTAGGHEAGGG